VIFVAGVYLMMIWPAGWAKKQGPLTRPF